MIQGGVLDPSGQDSPRSGTLGQMPTMSAKQVIEKHAANLLLLDGVVGVYEGVRDDGETVIKVVVLEDDESLARTIPGVLDGYPVEIHASGEIGPLGADRF